MEFGNEIHPQNNRCIREVVHMLEAEKIKGIIEWVPTYRSILIIYNPLIISYKKLIECLQELEKKKKGTDLPPPFVIKIPVLYGGEYGPDLEKVAAHNNLSEEEVIRIHSEKEYLIYMLGFTPGFPYLGGMSEKVATPRLKKPREKIPAGSVGIAATQTGIYPIDSPGGWQLIGRTPVRLFDPENKEPFLLKAGNYLKFVPISVDRYRKIEQRRWLQWE